MTEFSEYWEPLTYVPERIVLRFLLADSPTSVPYVPEASVERLARFASWLVSMDDPESTAGLAERRQVTLTKIIERARDALMSER